MYFKFMEKFIPIFIKDYVKNKKKVFLNNLKLDTSISVSENLKDYTHFVLKAANNDHILKNITFPSHNRV